MTMFSILADGAAQPAAQQAQQGSGFLGMLPMLIILAVFMFFIFRSQKKQQQKRQEMLDKLTKGTQVVYGGGIIGKIQEIKANRCIVENFDGSRNEILLNGIVEIVPAEAADAAPGK